MKLFAAILILNSCSMLQKVGEPPKVDICLLNVIKKTDTTYTVELKCKNQKGVKFNVPINKADKYVCFPPNQFVDAFTYVGKLVEALKIDVIK